MNLSNGMVGNYYEVRGMHLEQGITQRLESLGIFEGTLVEILNKKKYGAVIIKVRGARWAIGREFAAGIDIEEKQK